MAETQEHIVTRERQAQEKWLANMFESAKQRLSGIMDSSTTSTQRLQQANSELQESNSLQVNPDSRSIHCYPNTPEIEIEEINQAENRLVTFMKSLLGGGSVNLAYQPRAARRIERMKRVKREERGYTWVKSNDIVPGAYSSRNDTRRQPGGGSDGSSWGAGGTGGVKNAAFAIWLREIIKNSKQRNGTELTAAFYDFAKRFGIVINQDEKIVMGNLPTLIPSASQAVFEPGKTTFNWAEITKRSLEQLGIDTSSVETDKRSVDTITEEALFVLYATKDDRDVTGNVTDGVQVLRQDAFRVFAQTCDGNPLTVSQRTEAESLIGHNVINNEYFDIFAANYPQIRQYMLVRRTEEATRDGMNDEKMASRLDDELRRMEILHHFSRDHTLRETVFLGFLDYAPQIGHTLYDNVYIKKDKHDIHPRKHLTEEVLEKHRQLHQAGKNRMTRICQEDLMLATGNEGFKKHLQHWKHSYNSAGEFFCDFMGLFDAVTGGYYGDAGEKKEREEALLVLLNEESRDYDKIRKLLFGRFGPQDHEMALAA